MSQQQDRPVMVLWQCHKVVHAAKIVGIEGDMWLLDGRDGGEKALITDDLWKRLPTSAENRGVGGYLVRYEDGYESWSPAKAFEEGYTRI